MEMSLKEILPTGSENAITGREICERYDIKIRDLTLLVEAERRKGVPICANQGTPQGYFLAANKEEMERYCKQLYRRGGNLFKTRRACLKTIDKLPA